MISVKDIIPRANMKIAKGVKSSSKDYLVTDGDTWYIAFIVEEKGKAPYWSESRGSADELYGITHWWDLPKFPKK